MSRSHLMRERHASRSSPSAFDPLGRGRTKTSWQAATAPSATRAKRQRPVAGRSISPIQPQGGPPRASAGRSRVTPSGATATRRASDSSRSLVMRRRSRSVAAGRRGALKMATSSESSQAASPATSTGTGASPGAAPIWVRSRVVARKRLMVRTPPGA
ncbi:MAG: hypothetical protein CVU56_24460 [Deltaproteobacteria bacterium HGW-Deltaproteobacteria-14]|nr:MAG: hypothetical protein CVU56_24460 [Deltaproteobacteria bacterium HGW-Deltaproteobacteria-14]